MAKIVELIGLGVPAAVATLLGDETPRPTTAQLMGVGVPPFLADALGDRVIIQNPTPAILAQLGMPAAQASAVTISGGGAALSISGTPGSYTAGQAGSFVPTVSGGTTPYSFSLSGSLPNGWSFSSSTGGITIPSSATAGTVSGLSITVTDAKGASATLGPFAITVAAASAPLRIATTNNRLGASGVSAAKTALTGTTPAFILRDHAMLAGDVTELRIIVPAHNVYTPGAETYAGNDISYAKIAVEITSGGTTATIPVTFSGARNVTAGSGTTVVSDPIPFSGTFGATLPKGSIIRRRAQATIPNGGGVSLANYQNFNATFTAANAARCYSYDTSVSGNGALDPVDGTGAMAQPSGYVQRSPFPALITVGRFAAKTRSVICVGDSIMNGVGDTVSQTDTNYEFAGNGFVDRAMVDSASTNAIASLNLGVAGESGAQFNGSGGAYRRTFFQYGNMAFSNEGTNDINTNGASTLTSVQNALTALWSSLSSAGLSPIIQSNLQPRTSSTDSFATTANQTPVNGWASGGVRDQVVSWLSSKVSDNTLAALVDTLSATQTSGDNTRWPANGTNGYATGDGTHPSAVFHAAMAAPLRTALLAVTPAAA